MSKRSIQTCRALALAILAGIPALAGCQRANTRAVPLPSVGPASAPAGHDVIISPAALAAAVSAGKPQVILYVTRGTSAGDTVRIPGSRDLPFDRIVTERGGLPNELPAIAVLDSVLESVGVSDDVPIIIYGEPLAAARAFFTLDVLGHGNHTAVLDGGLAAWRLAGQPIVRATASSNGRRGRFTPRPLLERVVDASWVAARARSSKVALLDARPPDEYRGDRAGDGVPRPGHIPGAASFFWKRTIESDSVPRLLAVDSLRALFAAAGAEPGDTIVTYCRTGVQASHAYLVARHLGYSVRMYDGSFIDWSRQADRPVATGAGGVR